MAKQRANQDLYVMLDSKEGEVVGQAERWRRKEHAEGWCD